jgi:WD40 repeat protein
MTTTEALRVVEAGGPLVAPDVAEHIVRFVASARTEAPTDNEAGVVEPALLSVFCRELNNTRRAQGRATITADLLEGSRTAIIADFYERTISAGDLSGAVRVFVEERLLTESGFRDSVAEEQALRTPGVTQADIDTLIGRRLLRREDAGSKGRARLELTHDVLADAVRTSRDRRRLREQEARALAEYREIEERARQEAEEAAAREQQRREFEAARALAAKEREAAQLAQALARLERRARRRQIAWMSALLVATSTLAWFTWREAQRASQAEATANRALSAADVARVTRGEPWALAYLARAVRTDPDSVMARALLRSHLAAQVLPLADFTHDAPLRHAVLDQAGTHVLTVTTSGAARLWDVRAGTEHALALSSPVTVALFTPDGTRVVTGTEDGQARVWDTATAAPVGTVLQHDAAVNAIAVDRSGTRITTASDDQRVRIWTLTSGQHLTAHAAQDPIVQASFDASGTRVMSVSSDGDGALWDATSGAETARFGLTLGEMEAVTQAAFSADGRSVVAVLVDGSARVFDTTTGRVAATIRDAGPIVSATFDPTGGRVVTTAMAQGTTDSTAVVVARLRDATTGAALGSAMSHGGWVSTVAFSPDGTRLLTASHDHTTQVWDAGTGTPIGARMTHARPVVWAGFSPDGTRVLTASEDATAQLWDAHTGRPLASALRHEGPLVTAAFSTDGATVLTASSDGAARVWDARTGSPVETRLQHDEGIILDHAAFSGGGTRVATAGSLDPNLPDDERTRRHSESGLVRLWDVATGLPVGQPLAHPDAVHALDFSPAGPSRLVTGSDDHAARIWDADTGVLIGAPLQHEGAIVDVAFSHDGRRVVTASADGTARVWDGSTGQPVGPPLRHASGVLTAAFSPDGSQIATGTEDGTTSLWHAETGEALTSAQTHEGPVIAIAFSEDGRRALTSSDAESRVWNVARREPVGATLRHSGAAHPPALSPDGSSVVTTSPSDPAGVWNIDSPIAVVRWDLGREDAVVSARFSTDGRLVTASEDGTARVWHARTRQEVSLPLRHPGAVRWATFSPDNTRVLTLAADGAARVWEVPAGVREDQGVLVELAEALGGHAVDAAGGVVRLEHGRQLRDGLRSRAASATPGGDASSAASFARWLFADPWTRTISPLSAVTVPEFIRRATAQGDAARRGAAGRYPGHPALVR